MLTSDLGLNYDIFFDRYVYRFLKVGLLSNISNGKIIKLCIEQNILTNYAARPHFMIDGIGGIHTFQMAP